MKARTQAVPAPPAGHRAPVSRVTYRKRRRELMQRAGIDAAVIAAAAPEQVRSRDTRYPYRQDSDLWYLSGFPEPGAVLVLLPARRGGKVVLFCRERDAGRELWDGPRIGPDAAVEVCGVDAAYPLAQLDSVLPSLLARRSQVYCSAARPPALAALLDAHGAGEVRDLGSLVDELRLIKDAEEIALLREAARISVQAHAAVLRAVRPGVPEYHVQAELEYVFARHGTVPAYASIVGSGANACVLHYHANAALIRDGDLVLVDAGAEHAGYAADITRTIPANGRFTREQRALHDLVCAAQAAAIACAHPGSTWDAIHTAAVRVLVDGLLRLRLLRGSVQAQLDSGDWRRFYPHKTGHWLGLDVHDVGAYEQGGQPRALQPGMVLTIEPGLYIRPGMEGVDSRWWGIGIRIEDDLLITDDGHEVLTAGLARSAAEIEAEMGQWMY